MNSHAIEFTHLKMYSAITFSITTEFCYLRYHLLQNIFINSRRNSRAFRYNQSIHNHLQASVQLSHPVVSDLLRPHERSTPCPIPSPGVLSDSCPSSQWCHPLISNPMPSFPELYCYLFRIIRTKIIVICIFLYQSPQEAWLSRLYLISQISIPRMYPAPSYPSFPLPQLLQLFSLRP